MQNIAYSMQMSCNNNENQNLDNAIINEIY